MSEQMMTQDLTRSGGFADMLRDRFSVGEFVGLIASLAVLIGFYALPFGLLSSGPVTGVEWLTAPQPEANNGRVAALVLLAVVGWISFITVIDALIFPTIRPMITALLAAMGVIGLLYFSIYLFNSSQVDIGESLSMVGIGFWTALAGCIGLIGQAFIQRRVVIVSVREEQLVTRVHSFFVLILAMVFAIFPIIFVSLAAFNPEGTISTLSLPDVDNPSELLSNFDTLLRDEEHLAIFPFWNWLFNSFFVASVSTVLVVLVTALSAYSFSRFRFRGRRQLLLGVLLIQVFPNLLAIVALFLMLQQISQLPEAIPRHLPFLSFIDWGWLALFGLDSLGGLILVYMAGAMGINTWLMKGFFDSIPRDIDESALVDGATHWQIFWQLIFPLVRPILAVVGVLAFVGTFNEFVLARVLLRDNTKWTLMVGLFQFVSGQFRQNWGKFAAGALVSAIPVVIIYLALQDQIVGGLTAGSVKG